MGGLAGAGGLDLHQVPGLPGAPRQDIGADQGPLVFEGGLEQPGHGLILDQGPGLGQGLAGRPRLDQPPAGIPLPGQLAHRLALGQRGELGRILRRGQLRLVGFVPEPKVALTPVHELGF